MKATVAARRHFYRLARVSRRALRDLGIGILPPPIPRDSLCSELVILESPYAGDVERNVAYARRCMRDLLIRGYSPIASHLLYTQPGVLDDGDLLERQVGIAAGLQWLRVADLTVFAAGLGWSRGMLDALDVVRREGCAYCVIDGCEP